MPPLPRRPPPERCHFVARDGTHAAAATHMRAADTHNTQLAAISVARDAHQHMIDDDTSLPSAAAAERADARPSYTAADYGHAHAPVRAGRHRAWRH